MLRVSARISAFLTGLKVSSPPTVHVKDRKYSDYFLTVLLMVAWYQIFTTDQKQQLATLQSLLEQLLKLPTTHILVSDSQESPQIKHGQVHTGAHTVQRHLNK